VGITPRFGERRSDEVWKRVKKGGRKEDGEEV